MSKKYKAVKSERKYSCIGCVGFGTKCDPIRDYAMAHGQPDCTETDYCVYAEDLDLYKPLEIVLIEKAGLTSAHRAMRLPIEGKKLNSDKVLAQKLVKREHSHSKFSRGIVYYVEMKFQIGWMVELDTYVVGRQVLSTSSSMHNELKGLSGVELAVAKQEGLATKVYTQVCSFTAPTLRRIWKDRRSHRHPDWQIFTDWIETLPEFTTYIVPEMENKEGAYYDS